MSAFFRELRKGPWPKVMLNLAVALLCFEVIVLAGIERTSNKGSCIAVAVLLHYFLLVSFAWMLVDAVLQYMIFVSNTRSYEERFMLKTALPAWSKHDRFIALSKPSTGCVGNTSVRPMHETQLD